MRITPSVAVSVPSPHAATPAPLPMPPAAPSAETVPGQDTPTGAADPWTNPAAAAALRSTVDLLTGIEEGIVRNFGDASLVRQYAVGLRSTMDIFDVATHSISSDASAENDAFLPLIENAGSSVGMAETRLSTKELTSTWPLERGEILAAIRRARALSTHVADQLDPRSRRPN